VLQAYAEAAGDGATVASIEALADAFLQRDSVVALAPVAGEARFSTCELVAVERGTLATAVARVGARVATVDAGAVDAAIKARPSLSDEQRELVVALTRSGRGVEVVRSPAGSGKTFALDAAREAWQASGVPVLGCALSARAACELRDQAAVEATTIARLTHALDLGVALAPRTVLLVDEAGVVGTRALARLADAVTAADGKLVLVGDDGRSQRSRLVVCSPPLQTGSGRSSCAKCGGSVSRGIAMHSRLCATAMSICSSASTRSTAVS
jgi:hypothetical protein